MTNLCLCSRIHVFMLPSHKYVHTPDYTLLGEGRDHKMYIFGQHFQHLSASILSCGPGWTTRQIFSKVSSPFEMLRKYWLCPKGWIWPLWQTFCGQLCNVKLGDNDVKLRQNLEGTTILISTAYIKSWRNIHAQGELLGLSRQASSSHHIIGTSMCRNLYEGEMTFRTLV